MRTLQDIEVGRAVKDNIRPNRDYSEVSLAGGKALEMPASEPANYPARAVHAVLTNGSLISFRESTSGLPGQQPLS